MQQHLLCSTKQDTIVMMMKLELYIQSGPAVFQLYLTNRCIYGG